MVQKNSICDGETSDEHMKNRQFNPDLCVLSILEGFGHEIGIIAEAFHGYLSHLSASTRVRTNEGKKSSCDVF